MSKYYNRTKGARLSFSTTGQNLLIDLQAEMRIVDLQRNYLQEKKQEIEGKLLTNPYDYELLEGLRDVLGGLHSLGVDYPIKIKNDEIMYKNYVIDHIDMTEAS